MRACSRSTPAPARRYWEQELEDWQKANSSTGAPLIVGDLVIAGIGGAECGVRGFAQAIAAGRRVHRQRCYVCHLSEGGHGTNPFKATISDETFLMTAINGCSRAIMPAFGLKMGPDEVWQVQACVRSTDHCE